VKLSTKLTLSLTVTSTVILGSYGVWQLRREERDLRRTAEHDLRLLGTAVQVSVENSVRDRQVADVREILDALEVRDSAVDVLVFDADRHLQALSSGSEGSVAIVRGSVDRVASAQRPEIYFDGPDGLARLVGVFPLRDDAGAALGEVAVVWPLDELRRDLRETARAAVLSSLTLIAGITCVGWLLALLFVRRPLRTLTAGMRAVEAGDWVTSVPSIGDDEVGAALSEFNVMVRELAQARQKLLAAAESQQTLARELRRLDRLATVGQLAAGLAHEIGSPLQVLNGRARAIAARTDVPPEIVRSAQIVDQQSDRIARTLEQLLNLTRRRPATMSDVSVEIAVTAIIDLMQPEARRRQVDLRLECATDLPKVCGNLDHIQQVAMNLLSNAFRAAPAGGQVSVVVAASAFTRVAAADSQTAVRLVVTDTGVGMSADTRRHIFEPFFTTWIDDGGTGLGLAIVKSIVDEHGGLIEVTSDSGRGTVVTVHFPVTGPVNNAVAVA
jgi:signal transduction histidine kinase